MTRWQRKNRGNGRFEGIAVGEFPQTVRDGMATCCYILSGITKKCLSTNRHKGEDAVREDPSFMLTVLLITVVIILIPYIFYLLTLQKALSRVSEPNREMSPGLVWLNLIPLFSLGWQIYTVAKISNSLRKEYAKRNIQEQGSSGYGVGLTFSILAIVSIIPYIGTVVGLAFLVCWIIYWVQIAGYSRKIA